MYLKEEWRDVIGLQNYQVSNIGNVRSVINGNVRILKPRLSKGYYTFHFRKEGKDKNVRVHRAVCEAFHGPAPQKEMVAAHNDGNSINNAADNLRWATQSENALDRAKHGRPYSGSGNPNAKLSGNDILVILKSSESAKNLAEQFNITRQQIWRIRKRKSWNVDVTALRDEAARLN